MKKILFGLAVGLLLLSGCKLWFPDYSDYLYVVYNIPEIDYSQHPHSENTILVAQDEVIAVAWWVALYVEYTSDREQYDKVEYWATPEETYWNAKGDCEDFTLMTMYLLKRDIGIETEMITGLVEGQGHAWISVDGRWLEATSGRWVTNTAIYEEYLVYNYAEALGIAAEVRSVKPSRDDLPFIID